MTVCGGLTVKYIGVLGAKRLTTLDQLKALS